jgi:hypothetical protein
MEAPEDAEPVPQSLYAADLDEDEHSEEGFSKLEPAKVSCLVILNIVPKALNTLFKRLFPKLLLLFLQNCSHMYLQVFLARYYALYIKGDPLPVLYW